VIDEFQHVCITCRNLEASTRFYEQLGLAVIEPVREVDEQSVGAAMGLPNGHFKVLHLAPPDATNKFFIDLVQWLDPASSGEPYPALNHVGINRLAFRVTDIDATTAALKRRGIKFLSEEPQYIAQIRTIFTTDPDGVFIQLLEWR
jgi:catechol 2,3-dioxygenase-like lactoylglutathione lyase family enzyme